jgi:hypothetical protein
MPDAPEFRRRCAIEVIALEWRDPHGRRGCGSFTIRDGRIAFSAAVGTDFMLAPDAETSEKQVAEEHKISETLRNRMVAIRED